MNVYAKRGVKNTVEKILIYALLIFFTFMALYPLLWLLMSSFKSTQDYQLAGKLTMPFPSLKMIDSFEGINNKFILPIDEGGLGWTQAQLDAAKDNGASYYSLLTFANYPGAWIRGKFGTLFLNSILYTGVTTIAILYFSIAAGFAFSKLKCKATGFIYKSFVIGVLITLQCILIPLFFMANWTGLYDTRVGVLICYIGIGLPMGVYLATEFVRSIPESLVESARIDGAQYLKIFVSIIFPMAKPVGVTLAILNIAGTWNEFMLVNILASSESIKSLPVGVQKFSGALASDFGKQFAALIISVVPMIIFYIIFRKQITQGVAAGAVKG